MLSEYTKRRIYKKKKIILTLVFIMVLCVIIITTWSPDLYFFDLESLENVSCHYSKSNDGLISIGNNFNPPKKSIYFLETSCRGRLNSRQACAVESAAKTHPNWQVNLLFVGPVTKENLDVGSLVALKKYENIKILRIHLVEYAKGTPLESMINEGVLNRTRWRISHTSDALRYLTLYKWGGVYLDLDVVVVKSFDELASNWAARESDTAVAAGALSFSHDELGRRVADAAIRDFKTNFRGDFWGHNGPGVITRTLQEMCDTETLIDMSANSCKGFEVYGPELFYPVNWLDAADYFKLEELHVGEPYTYHVWNKLTEDYKVEKKSAYAKLAQKYCPEVYKIYGDNFGL